MEERLKIAIADDEPFVCTVIQKAIDYDGIGLELVGVAYDGVSLLRMITETRPAIVICDINMPGMSGLELIKEVRQRNIECKFVIISGYSKFDYAREALKYKVDDYLLKPIDESELNDVLVKLHGSIQKERIQHSGLQVLEENSRNKETIRKLFLSRLYREFDLPKDTDAISREYGISFTGDLFQGAVVKFDLPGDAGKAEVDFESIQSKIVGIFKQSLNPYCSEILFFQEHSILYLGVNFASRHQKHVAGALNLFFEYARNYTELFAGLKITAGVGNGYPSVAELKKSLDEAKYATYCRITMGVDRIYWHSKLPAASVHIDRNTLFQQLRKDFDLLDVADYQKCMANLFSTLAFYPGELVGICMEIADLFFECNRRLGNEIEDEDYQRFQMHQGILNAVSLTQLRDHMVESVSRIMTMQLEAIKKKNAKPVREAIRFIKEHYHEHLELERVAEAINFNPVYISNVFKKETGENFIDYVNKYRIEMAKELLRTSNDNINRISSSVGFNDSKYFAKLFRKYVGLKPSEYRNIYG
ncbi:response regulator [Cohnella laeviribosi]|uniref:response regulator n=1 Tax=Cohnella laeviribosi TaxID=380174 RepID=UPI000364EF1C|nr:response regulator [Cohnella laeviribosi]